LRLSVRCWLRGGAGGCIWLRRRCWHNPQACGRCANSTERFGRYAGQLPDPPS